MTSTSPGAWSWGRIAGYTLVLAVVYVIAQTGAVIAAAAVQAILIPDFKLQEWLLRSGSDGVALAAAMFACAALSIPAVWALTRSVEPQPWQFLGVRRVTGRDMAVACGAMLVFIAITDPINVYLLDRPLVPPFMVDAYRTARKPVFLFAGIAVFAPLTEELLFRGFLFGALRSRGMRTGWVIVITAGLFALVHTQYDLHDLAFVLAIGLLFGAARARYDSVLPSMAMHAVANTVAFIETMVVARS